MQWERPWSRYLISDVADSIEALQMMELQMRGMEYSLASSTAVPISTTNQEQVSNFLQDVSAQLRHKIEQLACCSASPSTTKSDTREDFTEKPLVSSLQDMFPLLDHKWAISYFSCIDMLLKIPINTTSITREQPRNPNPKTDSKVFQTFKTWILGFARNGQLEPALKCSLSLGLAVLFGSIFDRQNGCWAGLTIAISFVTSRQPLFTNANARAQGTAIGSAYGVICCFLFHREEFRLLALLPWIVLASFLRHSRMYGPTGGVSAAVGALLILGRKHYGLPNEFAVARLAEVFIGLSALIAVELLIQPTRADSLAKNCLHRTLSALHDCIEKIGIHSPFDDKRRSFNSILQELEEIVEEADLEPNFWHLPFRTSCYRRIMGSLSNISDIFYFITCNYEVLRELSENGGAVCRELHEWANSELESLQDGLRCSQVHIEMANLIKTRAYSQEGSDENSRDLEDGENEQTVLSNKHGMAMKNRDLGSEDSEKLSEQTILCLGAIGFFMSSLIKEMHDINSCIREIDQWENGLTM